MRSRVDYHKSLLRVITWHFRPTITNRGMSRRSPNILQTFFRFPVGSKSSSWWITGLQGGVVMTTWISWNFALFGCPRDVQCHLRAIASSDIKCGWINKHSHPLALSTTLTYILLPPKITRRFVSTLAWFLLVLEIYSVLSLFNINHLRVFFKHQERIGKATSLLCSRPSPPAPNLLSRASNSAEPNAMQDNYQLWWEP